MNEGLTLFACILAVPVERGTKANDWPKVNGWTLHVLPQELSFSFSLGVAVLGPSYYAVSPAEYLNSWRARQSTESTWILLTSRRTDHRLVTDEQCGHARVGMIEKTLSSR